VQTVAAASSNAMQKLQRAQNRWVLDFAELSQLFRQLTAAVETNWEQLEPPVKAWAQVFTYHPSEGLRLNLKASLRGVFTVVQVYRMYVRQDPAFLDYVDNMQRFRRAVMNAVERHSPAFQAQLSTATRLAMDDIVNGKAEVVGSTEEEIREWFARHRLSVDQVH
jgi:hypothetical protein